MTDIRKSIYTEEPIIRFIKQAEAGMPIKVPDVRRLRKLEAVKAKLKRV